VIDDFAGREGRWAPLRSRVVVGVVGHLGNFNLDG
jgi:hypothetical protein